MREKSKYYLTIPDAEELLRDRCMDAAIARYGDILPQEVAERLEKELYKICENGFATHYLVAAQMADASKEQGFPVTTRGHIGSALVSYLCGIMEVNPLTGHYCCPKCHHFELISDDEAWWNPGYGAEPKTCPDCGELMHGDGADIPSEVSMGFWFDREPNVTLNFAPKVRPKVIGSLKASFGEDRVFRAGVYKESENGSVTKGVHPGGIYIIPEGVDMEEITTVRDPAPDDTADIAVCEKDYLELQDHLFKYDVLEMEALDLLHELESATGRKHDTFLPDDKTILEVFWDDRIKDLPILTDEEKMLLKYARHKSFCGLAAAYGRMKSDWIENKHHEDVEEERYRVSESVSSRDDVMQFLMYKGMNKEDAYRVMESVRKGKGLDATMSARLEQLAVPAWFVNDCKNARYLYPRSQMIDYMKVCWALAGYLCYYPEVFRQIQETRW